MKVLYAFPEPLPLPRARGIQVLHSVRALRDAGVDVLLVHAPGEGSPPGAALSPSFLGLRSNRFFNARLARLLEDRRPDVLFARHLKTVVAMRRRFPRLPILYEAHEVFADTAASGSRARISRLESTAVAAATRIVANSGGTARRLAELYGVASPIAVIPNGVERPARMPEKAWSEVAGRVVYAGSLFPWKGVAELVKAATDLPAAGITIAGGEEEEVKALRAVAPGSVRFTGRLAQSEVRALLEQSCIAVLPNRPDAESRFTSPIKLFEYMAAGCAVVASDLPSLRELLQEEEAAWFTPGDAASLAAALRSLADDPARAAAMGRRLFEKSERFTWSARAQAVLRVLKEL